MDELPERTLSIRGGNEELTKNWIKTYWEKLISKLFYENSFPLEIKVVKSFEVGSVVTIGDNPRIIKPAEYHVVSVEGIYGNHLPIDLLKIIIQNWPRGNGVDVTIKNIRPPLEIEVDNMIKTLNEQMESARIGGPTVKTQIRFEVFYRIKKAHPEFTYNQVALEAIDELGDPNINAKTVENTYHEMNEIWPNRRMSRK